MKKQQMLTQRVLAVPLMILFILCVYGLNIPNPMIILIILVLYFTYSDGYISGILSGVTAIAYALYFFLIKTGDPAGHYKVITIVLSIATIIILVGKLKAREGEKIIKLKRREEDLTLMATTDKLTGALNRHAFFDMGNALYKKCCQLGKPVSVLFIDIDHFKLANDQYGHEFGDAVLTTFAGVFRECLRSEDVSCRYGGEEFVLLLANADADAALLVAHRIVEHTRNIRFEEYPDFRLTISVGVSSMLPSAGSGLDLLIRCADSAMFRAKTAGRDQVMVGLLEESAKNGEKPSCQLRLVPIKSSGSVDATEEENYLIQDILLQALDQMLELVYVVDTETYEILYINSAGKEKYGIEDNKSAKCFQLLHGLDNPCSFCINDRLSFNSIFTWKFLSKKLDKHFILRDRLIYWGGRKARLQVATDISEQEKEHVRIQGALEAEQTTSACLRLLNKTEDLNDALGSLLEHVGEYTEADRVYLFLLAGKEFISAKEWHAPQLPVGIRASKVRLDNFHRLWSLYGNKECVIIDDIEGIRALDAQLHAFFHKQKIKNFVFMPLEIGGDLIGFWGMENPSVKKIRSNTALLLSVLQCLSTMMVKATCEQRLGKMSFEDVLTGLGNRNQYLQEHSGPKTIKNTGIAYISINGLKGVNDTFGYASGDRVLIDCAHKIKETFPTGLAYRVGGDEFIVLCKDISQERFEQYARNFKIYYTNSRDWHAAIGHQWVKQAEDIRDLRLQAEALMYEDKKGYYRKNLPSERYRYYNDDVFCLAEPGSLEKKIAFGFFVIYLQPKVSFVDRSVSSAEALIRYRQEDGTIVSPAQFVPMLEDAMLISVLDFFVFDRVCAQLSEWIAKGRDVVPISINFSRYTLAEPNFFTQLQEVYGKYGIDKQWITIEVTESVKGVAGIDLPSLIDNIRAFGFAISIDDFGADFANLSLFSSANFDEIKMDKSLVNSLLINQKSQLIIESVVTICRKMGIRVVAEGVETEEQFYILQQNGCEQAQGYLFSKPVSIQEYEERFITGLKK